MEQMNDIAQLLPEGLSDDAVNEIAKLVDQTISEQVEQAVKNLESQVVAFVRTNVEELKEQAIRELELENDTFRNAQLFESMKSLMAVELKDEDEAIALTSIVCENKNLEEESHFLTSEIDKYMKETTRLESIIEAQSGKIDKLANREQKVLEQANALKEATQRLEESGPKPFKSSEQAQLVSENRDERNQVANQRTVLNEFLSEAAMNLMPTSKK
tara:strand:+ start:144 stop:791 length:648 start_codon:yes stop_codon:yes gene_type:complete